MKEYTTVAISKQIADDIDALITTGYWPSRTAFVREAALEKIKKEIAHALEKQKLKELI